jgi:RNA polymerase sigma-70 factor (ECF subfamily)
MKKGLEAMETRENYLPGKLWLSYGGSEGLKGEPMSLVEGDLIAQNLLILAYDRPVTSSDLSRAIGIPTAYIEPIVKKLVDGELMVQTDGGKVYTDFIITRPQNALGYFKPQRDFAYKHFETIWSIIERMSDRISHASFTKSMEAEQRTKLDRYATLKALQDFQHFGTGKIEAPKFPKRKDGGRWFAQATVFDAGYHMKEYNEAAEYTIRGGHRTSEAIAVGRTKRIRFYEFDTTLWDSPARYGGAFELYFKYIIPLLWSIYDDVPLDVPNEFVSYIPTLERCGIVGRDKSKLCVKIPVLQKADYDELCVMIKAATEEIKTAIGEEFAAFTASMKTPLPKHLTSVPELFRYHEATRYFVMSIVREAYSRKLHLADVQSCCPAVVLVYEE